jgi:hypothetical protein
MSDSPDPFRSPDLGNPDRPTPLVVRLRGVPQSFAELIDEIAVDAYDTDEQLSSFLQVFQDEVTVPARATMLGMSIEVAAFDLEGDERRGLVARCRHRGTTGTIALADVHFEPDSVAGWLHAACRTWLCLPAFPARRPRDWAWPDQ